MSQDRFDLVIRGGTVVTADGEGRADVAIRDGRIAQLGGSMSAPREVDAAGKLVIPGGVDMHVHLSPPWADDFASGSRAAAAGGVTTFGNMGFPSPGESLIAVVERLAGEASGASLVDFVIHPVLVDPSDEAIAEIPRLAEAGHTSIKIFMNHFGFDSRTGEYLRALEAAGKCGVLTMAHCEDGCLIDYAATKLVGEGRGSLRHYAETRPSLSEHAAVNRMIALAEAAEAPVYIVHLGGAPALAAARDAQARGQRIYVETRPIYLYFTREVFERTDGALFVGDPPVGSAADQEALWAGLSASHVHTYCTDHAAWRKEQKLDPALTVTTARAGVSDLETYMPLLYSEGVRTGRLSLQRFIEVTSTNAAKLFGLFPQKGAIAIGSDADVVIWDPESTRVVSTEGILSRAGYSLYEGWTIVGAPSATICRGEIVYADGAITGDPAHGRLVSRGPTRRL
ncbi:MAG TPA: amidohydrolase family protein [Acidimicrobiales bacterium]|nr:amidohydrolase family protein [Acidimicrobiales bacterium]